MASRPTWRSHRNQATPLTNLALGAEGERRAARYLKTRGYRIADRNVRAGGVEIDLIARRGRLVVFIEVKTRRSLRFGPPELAVDANKRRRLVRGAHAWLDEYGRDMTEARFDVIAWRVESLTHGKLRWHRKHLENAFGADD